MKSLTVIHELARKASRPNINSLRIATNATAAETVTINGFVFTFVSSLTGAVGEVLLGGSAAATITSLTAAINANAAACGVTAIAFTNDIVVATLRSGGPLAVSETVTETNDAWANAAGYGGLAYDETVKATVVVSRAANAQEVALAHVPFVLGFTPVAVTVSVVSAAGVAKAFDGTWVISGRIVDVKDTGSVHIVATDLVSVTASE